MAIGTSSGAYYDDAHHRAAADWDSKYDENVLDPEVNDLHTEDKNVTSPDALAPTDGGAVKVYKNDEPSPLDEQGSLTSNIVPVMDKANRFGLYDPKVGYTDYYNYDSNPNNKGPKGYDYDYQSFFKANPDAKMSPGQHYPDTYKKPNHPTFSDESQYNGIGYWNPKTGNEDKTQGGHWDKDDEGHDTFTPGKTNFDHHSVEELQEYFKRVEPKAKLLLPQSKLDSLIVPVSDIKTYGMNPMIDVPEGTLPVVGGGSKMDGIRKRLLDGTETHEDVQAWLADKPKPKGQRELTPALMINGEKFTGENHGMAFEQFMNKYPDQMPKDYKDGFLDKSGKFLSREEAMKVAKEKDLLNPSVKEAIAKLNAANDDSTMLLSEDLQ